MKLQELQAKIEKKTARLGVIGLGYVGLPLACLLAEAGFSVVGVEIRADRVNEINERLSPINGNEPDLAELLDSVVASGRFQATTDYEALRDRDVVFINVETPVDENHIPRYEALQNVVRQLGPVLQEGALVIVESTIAPGTMERVVRPLLEASSDRQMNQGFFLGHCPERVTPGKMLTNLRSMSRVCGGSAPEAAQVMVALYRHIVHADLDTADVVTAELVKTVENAYRDVQIAFANEVALICEVNGADAWRVRELVNKSPYRQMHLPGAGVGGHCIPKDPWLLAYSAHGKVPLRLIPAARAVNDEMPLHVADMTLQALQETGRPLSQARVAVLGYAYREDSDDTRSSPSAVVVSRLRELGIEVMIHDPWVPEYQGDLFERVVGCDAAVIMVGHRAYHTLDLDTLKKLLRTPIVIDGRGIFDMAQMQAAGFVYRGVGRGDKTGVKAANRVLEESIS